MNERIRILWEKAKEMFIEWRMSPGMEKKIPSISEEEHFIQEKFAQLIVKDCVREIGHKSADLLDIDFYPHYQERLKKHFGVEE